MLSEGKKWRHLGLRYPGAGLGTVNRQYGFILGYRFFALD